MNSETLAQVVAAEIFDEYVPSVIPGFLAAKVRDPKRWDTPIIELIQRSSPEDLEALKLLVKLVASDATTQVLGIVDPASGTEHCGDVVLRSATDDAELVFVESYYQAEAQKRGIV
jgi:hypothetical protein